MANKLKTFIGSIPTMAWVLLVMIAFSFFTFAYKNKMQEACDAALLPLENHVREMQYCLSKAYVQLQGHCDDNEKTSIANFVDAIQKAENSARSGLDILSRRGGGTAKAGGTTLGVVYTLFIKLQTNLQLFEETGRRQIKAGDSQAINLGQAQRQFYLEADKTLYEISHLLQARRQKMDVKKSHIGIGFNMAWVLFAGCVVLFALRLERTGRNCKKILRAKESRLRSLLEAFPDPVLLLDGKGVIHDVLSLNPNIFPGLPKTPTGQTIACLVGEENENDAIDSITKALADKRIGVFTHIGTVNEAPRYFVSRLMALPETSPPRVLWVVHDITGIRETHEQRLQLERRIQGTMRQESLGRMAEGIAHHFDNLLAGVMGHTEVALKQIDDTSPLAEPLNEIYEAASKAAELASQILKYSGNKHMAFDRIDLNQLVRDMDIEGSTHLPKGADLSIDYGSDPLMFPGDAEHIKQVIHSMTQNAVEALSGKSGKLSIHTGKRPFTVRELKDNYFKDDYPAGDYVFFRVDDTGCGIPEEDYDRLFDPFFSTKFTGRGMGLAVLQGVLRSHHGAIRVKSEEGKGTSFSVFFPCERQHPDENDLAFSGVLEKPSS